jgi:hypothetical protein
MDNSKGRMTGYSEAQCELDQTRANTITWSGLIPDELV